MEKKIENITAYQQGAKDVIDYVFQYLDFDGEMHKRGKCSFPMVCICSAEEHKIQNILYEARALFISTITNEKENKKTITG